MLPDLIGLVKLYHFRLKKIVPQIREIWKKNVFKKYTNIF